jgi:K+-transporting ATPase ATPase C chain
VRSTGSTPTPSATSGSSSGLDPHISPAAALYQVGRVARARGADVGVVKEIVERTIEPRTFGVLREPRVNVVRLNRELDAKLGPPRT